MDENENVTEEVVETGAESKTETGGEQEKAGADAPKTYTAEEFKAESEKLIAEALKSANAKSEAAFKKQLEDAKLQWEKESKMSAAEREKAAEEKARKAFEKEKTEFAHEKLVNRTETQLIKNGLPGDIAELITASDADEETIGNGISVLKAAFDKAVEAAVNEKLKGKTPPSAGGSNENVDPFLAGFGM